MASIAIRSLPQSMLTMYELTASSLRLDLCLRLTIMPAMNTKLCIASALLIAFTGCASSEPRPGDYATRGAPSADRSANLDAAEAALVDLGYTIARRDALDGVIVTEPIAIERTGERSMRADNPLRKIAEVRMTGPASAPKVSCKVVVQEQSEVSYRQLAYERGGDDLPGHQTAIDRDAATTSAQNTVWRTTRRDMISEREILDRLEIKKTTP